MQLFYLYLLYQVTASSLLFKRDCMVDVTAVNMTRHAAAARQCWTLFAWIQRGVAALDRLVWLGGTVGTPVELDIRLSCKFERILACVFQYSD